MRFLWAMRPAHPTGAAQGFEPPPTGRSDVRLDVAAAGKTVARASLSRRITPSSVHVRRPTVRHDGVDGYLFSPAGNGRRPAVVLFGGSGGRDETVGGSYGGEASLLLASTFPRLLHGAIGLVANAGVNESPDAESIAAWTYRGRAVPAGPIGVERIDGAVLTAGAGLDNVWDSSVHVQEIKQRRADARGPFHDGALIYPQAGHDVGAAIPYLPHSTDVAHFGGAARATAAATADLWPRILQYLARQRDRAIA
jgi:dienelactone hydrolase